MKLVEFSFGRSSLLPSQRDDGPYSECDSHAEAALEVDAGHCATRLARGASNTWTRFRTQVGLRCWSEQVVQTIGGQTQQF